MAFTHRVTQNVNGGKPITKENDYSGSGQISIDETIADSTTDGLVAMSLDVSQIKSIYIVATVAMLLETNSGSAPAETISLVADVPYVWTTDSYDTNLLATDITALFLTNVSGGAGNFTLECVYDATP